MNFMSNLKETTNPQEFSSEKSKAMTLNSVSFNVEDHYKSYRLHQNLFTKNQLENQDDFTILKGGNYIYFGGMLGDLKHGWGVLIVKDTIYEGQFRADQKNGLGYQKQHKGSVYNGEFKDNHFDGDGTMDNPDGSRYTGGFKQGLMEGEGMWVNGQGDKYIGQWKSGMATGRGVLMSSQNAKYQGQFKQFIKHGQGIETFANGDVYQGNFQGNTPNGYGQYYWSNGNVFKGIYKNGVKHGLGIWENTHGDVYEGYYANDKKCGNGQLRSSSGNVYTGQFFNDLRHGQGEMTWANGTYFKGTWQKGIQDGPGISYLPEKGERKGVFKGNLMLSQDRHWKEPSGLRRTVRLTNSRTGSNKLRDSRYNHLNPIPQHTQKTRKKSFVIRQKHTQPCKPYPKLFIPRMTRQKAPEKGYKIVPYGYRDCSVSVGTRGFPIYIKPNMSLNSSPLTVKFRIYPTRGVGRPQIPSRKLKYP